MPRTGMGILVWVSRRASPMHCSIAVISLSPSGLKSVILHHEQQEDDIFTSSFCDGGLGALYVLLGKK
jgi:hypothetical protein